MLARVPEGEHPTVLLLRAYSTGVRAKNSDNITGVMLKDLGCINIADSDSGLLEEIQMESILAADPDHIFVTTMGSSTEKALDSLTELFHSDPALGVPCGGERGAGPYPGQGPVPLQAPNARWGESYEVPCRHPIRRRVSGDHPPAGSSSLGAALLSMSFGSTQVPFSEILTALMGGETQAHNIVVYARLPHTLAALLCGQCPGGGRGHHPGSAGQPLAGPNIIGGECRRRPGGSPLRRPDSDLYDGGPGGSFPGGAGGVYAGVHPGPEDRGQPHHPGAGRGGHQQHALRRHRRGLHPVPGRPPWGQAALWWAGCLG